MTSHKTVPQTVLMPCEIIVVGKQGHDSGHQKPEIVYQQLQRVEQMITIGLPVWFPFMGPALRLNDTQ